MAENLTRRAFLTKSTALGCSAAASPFLTTASFASLPTQNRVVVIILRGGMDGLDVLRPWGDDRFSSIRPTLAKSFDEKLMLDQFHGLHPRLKPMLPLWRAGELAFVRAVSTPYRNKRSHFDGQDILEAGTPGLPSEYGRDGWLNRMLQGMQHTHGETAYSIGTQPMLLSSGQADFFNWSPDADVALSAQGLELLQRLYRQDPEMHSALMQAVSLSESDGDSAIFETAGEDMTMAVQNNMAPGKARLATRRVAEFAAGRLADDARVACFSIGGWDTHANQGVSLNRPLSYLADTLNTLKSGMGSHAWQRTTVVAMTEFGRTVRENGTKGTDHGTGGTMVLSGGALRGGRILGQWPGLAEEDLFERRDLMPVDDVRRWAAWVMRSSFGLETSFLEQTVFPGLELGDDPGILL
ncbi:DUF1501 domain-containing protein [Shimia sp.]|uniref:DUF1501 domain-containing protein n=1 Tax=Shimia sp. TaxID=1954381 RepID=UPI00329704EF